VDAADVDAADADAEPDADVGGITIALMCFVLAS
jgi:hypothetical protein